MEIKKVSTEKAPAAIGPYSQAIICGDMVFTSGQIPINPANGNIEAVTIEEQAEQVMRNLKAVLEAARKRGFEAIRASVFLRRSATAAGVSGKFTEISVSSAFQKLRSA